MIHLGYPKMCKLCKAPKIRDELDKLKEQLPKVEVKVRAEVIDTDAIMNAAAGAKKGKKTQPKATPEPEEESEQDEEEKPVKEKKEKKPTKKITKV